MEPSLGMAWSTALVAWVDAVPLWRFTQHTITNAHDGGHTVHVLLTGEQV